MPYGATAQEATLRGLLSQGGHPQYLDWSREAITFNRDDHPDHIPNPEQYPLVVDPIIGNTRVSKVLMDGGSGLNILYAICS